MKTDESVKALAKATLTDHACLQCIGTGVNATLLFITEAVAKLANGDGAEDTRARFCERIWTLNVALTANDKESLARLILDAGIESGDIAGDIKQEELISWFNMLKEEASEIVKKRGGGG